MRKVIFLVVLLCITALNLTAGEADKAMDELIKCEVETAVSMLKAINAKHLNGDMTLDEAKKLGADLLRDLRYGKDGYFWADTFEGVNVVLYGKEDVEGKNRWEAQDTKGNYFIKEISKAGRTGGGYVEYWFPKLKDSESIPKRSYALQFEPFEWVLGTGYYR